MYPFKAKVTIPKGKELVLCPFGDIQTEDALPELDDIVKEMVARKKSGDVVLGFGTGDYFETLSPSERVRKAGANFHETSLSDMNKTVLAKADDFVGRMRPLAGSVMALLDGHHWETVKLPNGTSKSSTLYIAEKLKAEFAGDGVLWIELLVNGLPYNIIAMHGYGSARTPGARLNKRSEMMKIMSTADWYVMGHDNSMVSDPRQRLLKLPDGSVGYARQYFSGVGCIQESYEVGIDAGYAEKLALPPACIGFVQMRVQALERNNQRYLRARMVV